MKLGALGNPRKIASLWVASKLCEGWIRLSNHEHSVAPPAACSSRRAVISSALAAPPRPRPRLAILPARPCRQCPHHSRLVVEGVPIEVLRAKDKPARHREKRGSPACLGQALMRYRERTLQGQPELSTSAFREQRLGPNSDDPQQPNHRKPNHANRVP